MPIDRKLTAADIKQSYFDVSLNTRHFMRPWSWVSTRHVVFVKSQPHDMLKPKNQKYYSNHGDGVKTRLK